MVETKPLDQRHQEPQKNIYVTYNSTVESILLPPSISEKEIKSILYSVANIPPNKAKSSILKLISKSTTSPLSVLVPIGPSIPENKPESAYILAVSSPQQEFVDSMIKGNKSSGGGIMNQGLDSSNMAGLKLSVSTLKKQILELENESKLESKRKATLPKKVYHIAEGSKYAFSDATKTQLKNPTFDNWQWDNNEIMGLFEHMFTDMNLLDEFNIEVKVLRRFLQAIKDNYHDNPFHNFRHSFCVTQMMYGIINVTGLVKTLAPIDKLVLMVSCIGHDLDHPGYNNAYQINAKTDIAIIYSDVSPLENHHCAMLFSILKTSSTNIFRNVQDSVYRDIRKGIIRCILATDMARHGDIMNQFKRYTVEPFKFDDPEQKSLLLQVIVKCSDISNEVRPADVAEPWVDCLLEEFFAQSDKEKNEGLPTAPFMDREKVTKPSAQIGFIGFVMIPLFELVAKVLPEMNDAIIMPIKKSLAYYKEMQGKEIKKVA